jgi:hypothetical protein
MASGIATIVVTRANGTKFSVGVASDIGSVTLESGWLGLHDTKRMLRRITLEAKNGSFKVEVYAKNNLKDADVLEGSYLTTGDGVIKLRTRSYNFFKFKILDQSSTSRWSITAMDVYGEETGKRVF